MLIKSLSTISAAYSLLLQQELQFMNTDSDLGALINAAKTGTQHPRETSYNMGRGRTRGGRSEKGYGGRGLPKTCSHYDKYGHTIDTCYQRHGYPPHLQRKFEANNANVNNIVTIN
ncbi:uncharacterized protein DS421_20g700600 [Arachis hypogaea]|nr:uncharacterized protein DS421_20g700600 [Arachis hypogaea]